MAQWKPNVQRADRESIQPPCGYTRHCRGHEWHIFGVDESDLTSSGSSGAPRVKLSVRSPRRFSRRLPAGIKNSGHTQSSPPAESVWLRVCASLSARVCTFMCARSVCLIDWPPSTPFKGKTRELSQRITRRRMQQLMCASCTVFLYLETACTHGGWWLWFDQMFLLLCFQTHLPDKAKS